MPNATYANNTNYDLATISGVLEQLRTHRHMHILWYTWQEANPELAATMPEVGDALYHREVERRYTQMIATIENYAPPESCWQRFKALVSRIWR